jgi:beta-galactosidase
VVNARTNPDSVRVLWEILNPAGQVVARQSKKLLASGGSNEIESTLTLLNPRRWDIADPALYQVLTTVFQGTVPTDQVLTSFGVRTIRFTADHGFYLNDRRVQLKGVNLQCRSHQSQRPRPGVARTLRQDGDSGLQRIVR